MSSDVKRRKIDADSRRFPLSSAEKHASTSLGEKPAIHVTQSNDINLRIQQAKNFAVAQAQQDGCTGNYRIFDSPYGNFLVPVIPTKAELGGK